MAISTTAALIAMAVVAAASATVAYTSSQKAADAQEEQARLQAQMAEEQAEQEKARLDSELQREKERIAYESKLAWELYEFEVKQQTENVEYAVGQTRKQEKMLLASQQVWASNFGLDTGSSLNVMNVTGIRADEDVSEFQRQLKQFDEKRRLEAEKVKEGGEFGFEHFKEARTEETEYTVRNLALEASLFRKKADAASTAKKYNTYGYGLKLASIATNSYATMDSGGAFTTSKSITASNVAKGNQPYGSFTTTRMGYNQ